MLEMTSKGSILLSIAACLAGGCAHPMLVATGLPDAAAGLVATGVGEAKAPPDIARTNLGVEVRAPGVDQATADANQRMVALIAAVKQLGVADKDLRTHSFSISFEQEQPPQQPTPAVPAAPAAPRGWYRVSNMVEVTIRDLDKAGRVLQAATDAGANNVWGISFELEDPKPLIEQARVKAVENAKQNATTLAALAGVKLGAIVSVTEGSSNGAPPQPMYAMKAMRESADVPVERGEITVTDEVQLVYSLPRPE